MAKDIMQQVRDKKANIGQLLPGQLGFAVDTNELLIGNGDGNKNIKVGGGEGTNIEAGSVTAEKLANGAVTEDKLAEAVKAKLNASGSGTSPGGGTDNTGDILLILRSAMTSGSASEILAAMKSILPNVTLEGLDGFEAVPKSALAAGGTFYIANPNGYSYESIGTASGKNTVAVNVNPQCRGGDMVIKIGETKSGNYYEADTVIQAGDTWGASGGGSGSDGIGIQSIAQLTNNTGSGEANTIRVTLTDGTTKDFNIYNGAQGAKGDKGDTGARGATGAAGASGIAVLEVTDINDNMVGSATVSGTPARNTVYCVKPVNKDLEMIWLQGSNGAFFANLGAYSQYIHSGNGALIYVEDKVDGSNNGETMYAAYIIMQG